MERDSRALTESDIRTVTSTQLTQLGAVGRTSDERVFRYCGVGSTAISAGMLAITPAVVANHTNINVDTSSPTAIGSTQINVVLGATAATQDQYAEGYLAINSGVGAGGYYKIKGNSAANANGVCTIYLVEALIKAITNGSGTKVCLYANPWSNLIVQVATPLSRMAGITINDVPANNYSWLQVLGHVSVLADGATSKGLGVKQSPSVAGAVAVANGAADADKQIAGYANEALVNGEYRTIWCTIQ